MVSKMCPMKLRRVKRNSSMLGPNIPKNELHMSNKIVTCDYRNSDILRSLSRVSEVSISEDYIEEYTENCTEDYLKYMK